MSDTHYGVEAGMMAAAMERDVRTRHATRPRPAPPAAPTRHRFRNAWPRRGASSP